MAGYRSHALAHLQTGRSQHQGQVREKNDYGRQLARVQAPQYHETVFSRIYPGKQDSGTTYIPILAALAPCLQLSVAQKRRTILRSDAGFGADANVNQALTADWQVLGKGKGGRRPQAYARVIAATAWQDLGQERWVAPASQPVTYVQPTQHLVLRWQTSDGKTKYSTVVVPC